MHVVLVPGRRTGMDSQERVSSFLLVILATLLSLSGVTVGSEELAWSGSSVPNGASNELNSSLNPRSSQPQPQDDSLMDSFSSPRSRSWYAAHNSDPSMGFFFGDSSLSSAGQRSSQNSQPSAASMRRRRDTTGVIVKTLAKGAKKKTKKKDSVKKSAKSGSSSGLTAVAVSPTTQESSRTFVLTTGIIAYLLPVFLAQMFGMGLIPAAGFILLPAFLLPIGLTAAVFLI